VVGAVAAVCLLSCGPGPARTDAEANDEAAVARDVAPAPTAAPAAAGEAEPIVLMWQVQRTGPAGDFAVLRRLGVNVVQASQLASWPPGDVRAYLDGAQREGLRVIVYLGILRVGSGPGCGYAPAALRFIDEYRAHAAIFAWHSLDEPAGHGIAPDCQRALYRAIKSRDPGRPVMISTNNDDEDAYRAYFAEDAFDIYEMHKYVNPHPAEGQRRLLDLLRSHRTRDYPVIVTLRAFNAPHKPLRLSMSEGSFEEQYEFFIAAPGVTRDFGFYGWDLAPNRGIRDDPAIRGAFTAFMERRLREPGQRLR
jgi:hypothetical protein